MDSKERHAARRARREEKRAARHAERCARSTLENVADYDNLVAASMKAANGTMWKTPVRRYHLDTLGNTHGLRMRLLDGEDMHTGFVNFKVNERGKVRDIAAVKFPERIIQKAANQYGLMPAVRDSLIYDNSANVKGKGTTFAVKRLRKQLADHYRKHGAEGYILLADFKGYFASIPHDGAKNLIQQYVDDEGLLHLLFGQIDHQEGCVGLTLGSEINQTIAVAYPGRIDHFVVECGGVEAYGRYMDDFYAIALSKEQLQLILGGIEQIGISLGLTLNVRKTHIVKLTHGFTYLKRKFSYGESGKIVMRPVRETITRERRKLKKQAALVESGKMTYQQAYDSYQSWRSHLVGMDAHGAILRMDALFKQLFARYRASEYPPPKRN